jgi:hypothetical protein
MYHRRDLDVYLGRTPEAAPANSCVQAWYTRVSSSTGQEQPSKISPDFAVKL